MRIVWMSVLAVAGLLSATACDPEVEPTPEPETCESASQAPVLAGLEFGQPYVDTWDALGDGDAATIEWGGQGIPMVVFRLRATGTDLPACLAQSTVVKAADGTVVGGLMAPLVFHGSATERVTDEIYIPLDQAPSTGLTIETTFATTYAIDLAASP